MQEIKELISKIQVFNKNVIIANNGIGDIHRLYIYSFNKKKSFLRHNIYEKEQEFFGEYRLPLEKQLLIDDLIEYLSRVDDATGEYKGVE